MDVISSGVGFHADALCNITLVSVTYFSATRA